MRLSTQLLRGLFALPLLAVGLAAGAGAEPAACRQDVAAMTRLANTVAEESAGQACAVAMRPAGARALARMPGDIGQLGLRVRCAS